MGTGWVFSPPDAQTLLACMDNALTTFYDFQDSWQVGCAHLCVLALLSANFQRILRFHECDACC